MENPIGSLPPLMGALIGQLLFLLVMYMFLRAPKKDLKRSAEARKIQRRINIIFFLMVVVEIGGYLIRS